MAHRRAVATAAVQSLHDFGAAAPTVEARGASGGTSLLGQQPPPRPRGKHQTKNTHHHPPERHHRATTTSSSSSLSSRRVPQPSTKSLLLLFLLVAAMQYHRRGYVPTDVDAEGSVSALGSRTRSTMTSSEGVKGGAHIEDMAGRSTGFRGAEVGSSSSRDVDMADSGAGWTDTGDPCDPEWGFDDGSEGDEEDEEGGAGVDRRDDVTRRRGKALSPPPPPPPSPPPPSTINGAFTALLGRVFGRGGRLAEKEWRQRVGRDGLPCVVVPRGDDGGGGGGEGQSATAGGVGGGGKKSSRRAAKRFARAAESSVLAKAMRAAGVTTGAASEEEAQEEEEYDEEKRKQLQFARRHSRRDTKRLKGVYALIRGVSVAAAEEQAEASSSSSTSTTTPPPHRVSLRDAVHNRLSQQRNKPPPAALGCGPRGEGPACASGLHEGVCQVVGGATTQVMNQQAIVKRGDIRESGADNAGHDGASLEATANATVSSPSVAEIAPGWILAAWVSNVPATYAPVAHLNHVIDPEDVVDPEEVDAGEEAAPEDEEDGDGSNGGGAEKEKEKDKERRRRRGRLPAQVAQVAQQQQQQQQQKQQHQRRRQQHPETTMRVMHGAQSEVHLAFYHSGRWSPTSAAVRWLEIGEDTIVGAAVLCPLPPERRPRGADVTLTSEKGEEEQKRKKKQEEEEEEKKKKEEEEEEERKKKEEEEEWHPWRRLRRTRRRRGRTLLEDVGARTLSSPFASKRGGGGGGERSAGSFKLGGLALLLRLDKPGQFPAAAVKRSFDGGRTWGPLEHRPPGVAAAISSGSCAALSADTTSGTETGSGAAAAAGSGAAEGLVSEAESHNLESKGVGGGGQGVGFAARETAVAVVVPTNSPGEMTCVARDALVRKGDKHVHGDKDGPREPAAVCAQRKGGLQKCKCWTEGEPFASADVVGPDGKVLAPLPSIGTKNIGGGDDSGGGGGGGDPATSSSSSSPSSYTASSWLAAAAIYPSGEGTNRKLRVMLRPAPLPRNHAATGVPGGLFGDVGYGAAVDGKQGIRRFRDGGEDVENGGVGVGGGGGGIVGIPWAHMSDLILPSAASLAAEDEGDADADPASWTPARRTRLATGGGGLAAVPLTDGRLLVLHHAVFGSDGRHVLAASVSRDGGDTWCAYGRWKTAVEVPRHILPPSRRAPTRPIALLVKSGGVGGGGSTGYTMGKQSGGGGGDGAGDVEAAADFMDADVAASLPLFDTRAITLEEEAPLECRRPPSGGGAHADKHHPRRASSSTSSTSTAAVTATTAIKGCDPASGVGDPAAAQETIATGGGGGGGVRGGMVHVVYVKDGTNLVHVVIDPEYIN